MLMLTWLIASLNSIRLVIINDQEYSYTQSVIFIVRCMFIPTLVKRIILIFPLLAISAIGFSKTYPFKQNSCSYPLYKFNVVAVILTALMAFIILLILLFGRHLIVSALPADNFEVLRPKFSISINLLWIAFAAVNLFSFCWGFVGSIWASKSSGCPNVLLNVSSYI
jgi:hypothetical protein